MIRDNLTRFIGKPAISGPQAIFWTIVAIGVPTVIRAAVNDFVSGCELTIYLPFILFAALFIGWRHAIAAALGSVLVAGLLIVGAHPAMLASGCFIYSFGVFLANSAVIIGFVQAIRGLLAQHMERRRAKTGGVVFSLEKGQAWASWYGQHASVQLGPEEDVAEMMEDFLAQLELGKRLSQSETNH